jgi:hypothetical protein
MFVRTGLTLLATLALLSAPAHAQSASDQFGRAKMNAAQIASTIAAMDQRVTADATKIPTIFAALAGVEDALYDFGRKYPTDSAVPRDLYALEMLYLKLPPEQGATFARQIAGWLRKDYPKTAYATRATDGIAKTPRSALPILDDTATGVAADVEAPAPALASPASPSPPPEPEGPPVTTVPSKPK